MTNLGEECNVRAPGKVAAWIPILAFVPVFADWFAKLVVHARPYWFYYDPETIYFYDGMRIARGMIPAHADNPGTPLQLLSAAIVAITGRTPLRYEVFLNVAHLTIVVFILMAMFALQRTLLHGLPALLQLPILWAFFLAPQALDRDAIWSPEGFYFPAGVLTIIALWSTFAGTWPARRRLLLSGVAVGFCIALKFVFLAWAPALLAAVLVSPDRWRTKALNALLAGSGVAIGFLVAVSVALPRLPESFAWLRVLVTHSGEYGGGAVQFPTVTAVAGDLFHGLLTSKRWGLWGLIVAALITAARVQAPDMIVRNRPLIAFALVAFAGSYALAIRDLTFRYLLPSSVAMLLLLIVAVRSLRSVPRNVQTALLVISGLLLAASIREDVRNDQQMVVAGLTLRARLRKAIPRVNSAGKLPVILFSWRVPEPSFALRLLTVDEENLRVMSQLYPREGHFQPWLRQVHLPAGVTTWDYLVVDADDLSRFPEPHGAPIARVDQYLVVPRE